MKAPRPQAQGTSQGTSQGTGQKSVGLTLESKGTNSYVQGYLARGNSCTYSYLHDGCRCPLSTLSTIHSSFICNMHAPMVMLASSLDQLNSKVDCLLPLQYLSQSPFFGHSEGVVQIKFVLWFKFSKS